MDTSFLSFHSFSYDTLYQATLIAIKNNGLYGYLVTGILINQFLRVISKTGYSNKTCRLGDFIDQAMGLIFIMKCLWRAAAHGKMLRLHADRHNLRDFGDRI